MDAKVKPWHDGGGSGRVMAMNSLGFDKAPADTTVVVAMSGGVDSSVTAALLAEQGYRVVGMTLQLYDHGAAVKRAASCCAGRDIHDARTVADRIGIPHYVLDYESRFRDKVIEDFVDSYSRGHTPIPCIRCNQRVKFDEMLQTARDLGADCLATGHYVRRGPGPSLLKGMDPARDQSYFLFTTTRDQLDFLRFPLGHMEKPAVRAEADRLGLAIASKPDSQDICFVPDGDYAALVRRLRPNAARPGEIVHLDGRVLGRHEGVVDYTVGQRKGLGVATGEPLYVIRLDPAEARVIVGPKSALAVRRVAIADCNWLVDPPAEGLTVEARLRSAMPPVEAEVVPGPDGTATLLLADPRGAVAPGQAAVFYQGERLVGGGWIRGAADQS